jgi:oligopeptidase B
MNYRLLVVLTLLLSGCASRPSPSDVVRFEGPVPSAAEAHPQQPPVAALRAHDVTAPHGAVRSDPYYWLRDDTRKDAVMLAYLKAENEYADAVLAPLEPLENALYGEIVGRIKQDDSSVPVLDDGWWYYTRFEAGKEYPIYARRAGSMAAPEQVMLDGNAMAAGLSYFQIGDWVVSEDGDRLAYAVDTTGRRQYAVRVKDLATGATLADEIRNAEPNLVWADDGRTLFYIEKDPVTLLSKRVKRHVLGTPAADDALVYEEADDSFYMSLMRTRSDDYLCIHVESTVSSESRCTSARAPGEFRVLAPRQRDFEYQADHHAGRWIIRTNWDAPNYRLMSAGDDVWGDRTRWKEWRAHEAETFIEGFELFDGYTVIDERSNALRRLRVVPERGEDFFVDADEPAYTMALGANPQADSPSLRFTYTSFTTPLTTYELDFATRQRRELKREPVLGGYRQEDYVTERLWAPARDGEKIPVTIVHRREMRPDGKGAVFQYAYGSYGYSQDPRFNPAIVSLLDRGVVYALAHIRGGQERGRRWYEAGRLLNKKNTFTDFIDVTDFLVREGWAAPTRVAAQGGSAGGLLMGAIANLAPEKYASIDAAVPFVDVVTTMLDASIPLTTNEYDEWGNPADPKYYEYMLSYSPYDQVKAQAYPPMYVSTGLWDSQVQYFEPAKWVARLRATKTDANPLLFRINMEAGHGGKSGRFQRFRELAERYAFALDQLHATELLSEPTP